MGALREEGVEPKISRNIFSRLAEIRENKCPRKNPAVRYIIDIILHGIISMIILRHGMHVTKSLHSL